VIAVVSTFTAPSNLIVPLTVPTAESGLGLYPELARSTAPAAESLTRARLPDALAAFSSENADESPLHAVRKVKTSRKARQRATVR